MNQDATNTPKLTERQLYILSTLIRTYTEQAEPVSSKHLSDGAGFQVSSATVRNEMAVLEQLGMIRAPHTSAGRIPTEEGYRYFVKHLLEAHELPLVEQQLIRAEFDQAAQDIPKWLKTAASVLAKHTQTAALVTEPRSRGAKFKQVQLIATHGYMVLMVLVLDDGKVLQHMLTLKETPDQTRLNQVTAMINATCVGENVAGLRYKAQTIGDWLAQEVMDLVADVLGDAESGSTYSLYWYGFRELVSQFEEQEGAQQALRILDEHDVIRNVLSESLDNHHEPVRVLVGGDGRFDEMSELSVVVGRYGNDQLSGAISVLGPTRMRYGRAINTVRYVATLMSAMMQDVYGSQR